MCSCVGDFLWDECVNCDNVLYCIIDVVDFFEI